MTTPTVEVKILDARLHQWGVPKYQSLHAAAIDLFACAEAAVVLPPQSAPVLISAGFALLMGDANMAALVLPRSGLGHRGLVLGNLVGLIDPDYTGPILVSAWNRGGTELRINPGDRFAQLMFVPVLRPVLTPVAAFSGTTARGGGGFGSTGD